MVSIGKIAAGPAAARYYTDQVAQGREDYYSGEGEEPGTWVGSGAGSLGLGGDVDDGRFAGLLAGAGVRRPPREGAVAGFDLTFRAPKSVSVLWAVASPDVARELRAGHDAAVAQALSYLERDACRARRGAGGVLQVTGRGFVGAVFVHRASRAGDPLLHTHVVVGNLTQGPDGRWTALDARHLYRQAKTAGYLYQAALRREVTERLGLEWTPVGRGVADVAGVPRAVIDHFSQRRAQILEHMAEHGGRSAASAQVAALETRRAKQHVPADRLRELWRSRAAEHGFDARAVAELLGRQAVGPAASRTVVPDALTEQASAFGRPEVLQALAEHQPRGASVAELERLADALLADEEVVRLRDGLAPAGVTEARFSTEGMLAVERELLDGAAARRKEGVAVAGESAVTSALAGRSVTDEQEGVVRDLCRAGDGVALVRASAGTGKTFTLDAAREAWQRDGIRVVGCALSARAALELSDQAGIESLTIASLRHRLQGGEELPRGGVLVVDEAGMVGTRDIAALARAVAEADAKVVLVGDDRQLPEIQAGGAFRALADRLGASELREVRRQRSAWDRAALESLRSGDVERWARAYRDRGHITVARSASETRTMLVSDWMRADGDRLMIAGRRDDVRDLNDRARQLLQAGGYIGADELEVDGRAFAVGDRVVGQRNDRRLGILNGQRGSIHTIDQERGSVSVDLDSGHRVTLDAGYLRAGHLDHGYAVTAHRAQGATVDRAFVLGSEELYREWGYTALSRHRDEARFYVARGDLGLERDHAPAPDPVIAGITRLISRSHAKELALDALPHADDQQLQRERDALRAGLRADPPPHTGLDQLADNLKIATDALSGAQRRQQSLRQARDELGWRDRRERAALDHSLGIVDGQVPRLTDRWQHAYRELAQTKTAQDKWLNRHGHDARRLVRVDDELRLRDTIGRRADRRIDDLQRPRDPLHTTPERPARALDLGLDIGR